jgi:2-polyprenyl-3-methyl-5-hydroxy-6-metoxy-1,4-benzoquinol methylase
MHRLANLTRPRAHSRIVPDETDRLRRSWIANAPAWRDAVRNRQIESRRLVTDAAVVEAVLEESPCRVLDLGCGEGWLARALTAHGIDVTGVDASGPLIEAAHTLGGGVFLAMSYQEIIDHPSLLGSGFDTIIANFSILDDGAEGLLSALRSVLMGNGRLIIQTAHPFFGRADDAYLDGWRTETFDAFPGEWPEAMPWYFRTLESWSRMLTSAGYASVEIREPMYPDRSVPASLMFVCRRAGLQRNDRSRLDQAGGDA